ncbi:hypothetical protein [Roseovarius aestuariivivens]|uniref:hypothetical protein n=1 Tax=Roseovarius aestuariivivens TaxID=1888910 RepID=UPI00108060A2|nr:hypothetical protein [Roseovarius aestuariivivens]
MVGKHCFKLAAATFLLSMQGALAVDGSRNDGYLSVTEQREALVDCKFELGRGGWPAFKASYVEKPWGGQTLLRIEPGANVNAQDAAWINSCADQKLGRSSEVIERPVERASGFCPKHAPVIYGGARYCLKR